MSASASSVVLSKNTSPFNSICTGTPDKIDFADGLKISSNLSCRQKFVFTGSSQQTLNFGSTLTNAWGAETISRLLNSKTNFEFWIKEGAEATSSIQLNTEGTNLAFYIKVDRRTSEFQLVNYTQPVGRVIIFSDYVYFYRSLESASLSMMMPRKVFEQYLLRKGFDIVGFFEQGDAHVERTIGCTRIATVSLDDKGAVVIVCTDAGK